MYLSPNRRQLFIASLCRKPISQAEDGDEVPKSLREEFAVLSVYDVPVKGKDLTEIPKIKYHVNVT